MRLYHRSSLAGFLFALSAASALAEPTLRIGSVDGMTDAWRAIPDEIELPVGATAQLEFSWGRNLADLNADGRVDLLDYATLSLCFSAPGERRPSACEAGSYQAADLDADGDVDIDDANALSQAMRNPQPYAVESVTWFGAHQISRTASRTRAQIDLREPGEHLVRVEAALIDPVAQRTVQLSRSITIHVVDSSPTEITAAWTQEHAPAARGSANPAVQILVNAFHPDGTDLSALWPGDQVFFEVGVSVDPTYAPAGAEGDDGNRGLADLVYNVTSPQAAFVGLLLNPMADAPSGFDVDGSPALVSSPFYVPSPTSVLAQYGGGWGFDRLGLPGGGDETISPGAVIAAGILAPLTFSADVNPNFPGLQPNARLDVGAGPYTFPPDDFLVGGLQGGFGQDLSNIANPLPGDGTWFFQTGLIDTTGWPAQLYDFEIIPTAVALFDGSLDYSQDFGSGFRVQVPASEFGSATFSITLQATDCNSNGVPDDQDILGGTSEDCNNNHFPDECDAETLVLSPAAKLTRFNSNAPGGGFGNSMAISGDTIVIGEARYLNGKGAAYVFRNNGSSWVDEQSLLPNDGVFFTGLGRAVAVSGDFALIGGNLPAAYVFQRLDTLWVQQQRLVPDDIAVGDVFGRPLAMHDDVAVIGARLRADNRGSAYVYRKSGESWIQEQKLLPDYGEYSFGGAIAVSGDTAVIGARGDRTNGTLSGAAYIYRRVGATWILEQKLLAGDGAPDDWFGFSVSISGDVVVIGAYRHDDNGPYSGAAYVFSRSGSTWIQERKLLPADGAERDLFAFSVAVSGDMALIGAPGDNDLGNSSGSAYVFRKIGSRWAQVKKLLAYDGGRGGDFGWFVLFSGSVAVVTSPGAAYVFEGISEDCDDDGVLDECQPFQDCNANSVQDICDVGLGTSQDCNANSIPDECELGAPFHAASLQLSPIHFNAPQSFTIASPPLANGYVVLALRAQADLRASYEFINVDINGTQVGVVFDFGGDHCYASPFPDQLIVPSAVFNNALAGGDATINMIANSNVNDFCTRSFISVTVTYDAIVVGDCNSNGVPDDCEPPEDCNANSVQDICDIALATSADCNVNAVPDECDIAATTSQDEDANAVPDECEPRLDIKPGSCPNSFNRNSHGALPVSLVGATAFDVSNVDLSTVLLSRADGVGGSVAPHEGPPGPQTVTEDLATPFVGQSCDCHDLAADGITDLSMKFRTDDVVAALELDSLASGALVELVVTGTLLDGSEFVASDCVRLVPPGTGPGMLAVNSNLPQAWIDITPLDSQLDGGGFGQFDRTWPQSTIVTLSAEEFYLDQRFVGWKFNDQFLSRDMTADVTVIDQPQTVDALFRRTGDITGDDLINLNDFAMFAVCFGQSWGNNLSGACANEALASSDLDRNGVIDLRDFATFALHFGT